MKDKELKELTKKVYGCKCMPLGETPYCENCHKLIQEYINIYGLGNLMQESKLYVLKIESIKKDKEIDSLKLKFKKKEQETQKNLSLQKKALGKKLLEDVMKNHNDKLQEIDSYGFDTHIKSFAKCRVNELTNDFKDLIKKQFGVEE